MECLPMGVREQTKVQSILSQNPRVKVAFEVTGPIPCFKAEIPVQLIGGPLQLRELQSPERPSHLSDKHFLISNPNFSP